MNTASPKLISVVVPCYNSGPWLTELADQVHDVMKANGWNYELILVNDASGPETWSVIKELAETHSQVRGLDLMFNTGQYRATLCGIEQAVGDIIVTMDDDLQHPPSQLPVIINTLLEDETADCVFGSFDRKRHGVIRNIGTAFMSWMFRIAYKKPKHVRQTTFRAMRRSLIDTILEFSTVNPNINPLIFQSSSRVVSVTVEHAARAAGKSGYGLVALIRMMLDNILSVSTLPLKAMSFIGFLSAFGSFCLGVFYLVQKFNGVIKTPGFSTQVLLICFFGGMTLMSIGLLGEYVIRIMDEVRGRPRYVIRSATDSREDS